VTLIGTVSNGEFSISERVVNSFDGTFETPYGYTYVKAGSTVTIEFDQDIFYVANILRSNVLNIQAFKETENGRFLVTVPSDWYEVRYVEQGPFTFTLVVFSRPMSARDETLEDQCYITQESEIGPNTVDEMIWLIETYTEHDWDEETFNRVRGQLELYPSHFAKLDRPNIIQMLEEMAFQARCAIWLNNGVFYIKYLPIEEDAVDTISEDNIDQGTLALKTTSTEELVTKLVATWSDDYAQEQKNEIIYRHNVKKYGTRERSIDFYIYNLEDLVTKSAGFWLIRMANIWKTLSFDCYVEKLIVETFDTVTMSFDQPFFSNTDAKCLVQDVSYDSSNAILTMDVWTPVRFGEMEPYLFSTPSQISATFEYPEDIDFLEGYAGGDGPGSKVEAEGFRAGSFALSGDSFNVVAGTSFQTPERVRTTRQAPPRTYTRRQQDYTPTQSRPAPSPGDGISYIYPEDYLQDNSGGYDQPVFEDPEEELDYLIREEEKRLALEQKNVAEAGTQVNNPEERAQIGWDTGDRTPSDLDDPVVVPNFPGKEYTPGQEPDWDYDYKDPELDEDPLEPEEGEAGSSVFPAEVTGAGGPLSFKIGTCYAYEVDVYVFGLSEEPISVTAIQLQSNVTQPIPNGSRVLVARFKLPDTEEGEPQEGLNGDGYEWTMQVPVWL
jgi:hypothetical protein